MLQMDNLPRTLSFEGGSGGAALAYIDQRNLPYELVQVRTDDWREVVDAISVLAVRGAPAIGIAGAAALALWSASTVRDGADASDVLAELPGVAQTIATARPTAVNLRWAVDRARRVFEGALASGAGLARACDELCSCVAQLQEDDELACRRIGQNGAALLGEGCSVLTHCNAGSLATSFYGTALGVVYSAASQGKVKRVYADETRPVGQGARLTVWELSRAGVPVTLICDNMAASLMANGSIDAVVVGADRIAANGDVANKIGTYGVALAARAHGVPFYVAAPLSTFDPHTPDGSRIAIEERDPAEVLPRPIPGVEVWNPAFDVTPARLVTAIITEQGVFEPSSLGAAL